MNLQERRLSIGLKQENLAAAAGISRTALSLIETGRLRPSKETLENIERALDPFSDPVRLVHGNGALSAAELMLSVARGTGLVYALTLDVAAWLLTRYQTPATCWAYVKPIKEWESVLRTHGVTRAGPGEKANLVLLRTPEDALDGTHVIGGNVLVSHHRLVQDCARLGGRHWLDAARIHIEFPEARAAGLRLDADSMLKVFEEVLART